jgi:alpha-beta hydrolase superfamily lysophospholipase
MTLFRTSLTAALALLLGACATRTTFEAPRPPAVPSSPEAAPLAVACPEPVADAARCLRGTDSAGAPYLIVVPQRWNQVLVVHAHGGPALGPAKVERADEDIKRWSIIVKAGYAYAASVYRDGGVAVRRAAEDTERVRQIFVDHVAQPRRTILHGQSWGGHVAAMAAQTYAAPGMRSPYDAVLLSSGMIGGGTRSYDFRLDLRVVYQALCNNHPRPDEPAYPLWQGLPRDAKLTRAELTARVDQCLGARTPAAQRTPEQARKLKTIADVIRIRDSSVVEHLSWATWHFQDIAFERAGGNVFDNTRVRYTGSPDDAALNAQVQRYAADPQAVTRFAADTALNGRIGVPVLTVHAVDDPTAFVEMESVFRDTMVRGGSGDRLVQTFTSDREHSYLTDVAYPTLFSALLDWVDKGQKPTPASIAAACPSFEAAYGKGCRFLPDYRPQPLEARNPAR